MLTSIRWEERMIRTDIAFPASARLADMNNSDAVSIVRKMRFMSAGIPPYLGTSRRAALVHACAVLSTAPSGSQYKEMHYCRFREPTIHRPASQGGRRGYALALDRIESSPAMSTPFQPESL